MKPVRCAIYTRKSSEDGLEQDFNSLDAQREACAAYIASQKHEGWVELPGRYDDGGISGGSLERPALQRLLSAIDDGQVDQIIVYKIDRLTRSLADFARLVDRLDAARASFVSVTQSFNTSTSMGRLTLNVLLSFAQFEREVTAERIRDKIAASKKKGLWMGGSVPLGYQARGRTLVIVEEEAQIVRTLFDLYLHYGSIHQVRHHAKQLGLGPRKQDQVTSDPSLQVEEEHRGSPAAPFPYAQIHYILANPTYAGRIRHHDKVYEGQHDALIDPQLWQTVQQKLQDNARRKRGHRGLTASNNTSLLAGRLVDDTGDRLTPSHAHKKGRRYRYYISHRLVRQNDKNPTPGGWRLPAPALEHQLATAVLHHLRDHLPLDLLHQPSTEDIKRISSLLEAASSSSDEQLQRIFCPLIKQAQIAPGVLTLTLNTEEVCDWLKIDHSRINSSCLCFKTPFQFKKRGVETKLVIGTKANSFMDPVLIRNLAKAHRCLQALKKGSSLDDIACSQNLSKARLLQLIDHALLAPDIVRSILQGDQPTGLTSDWLQRTPLPLDWEHQRTLIATL